MSRNSDKSDENSRSMKILMFVSSVLGLLVGLATGVPEGKALAARLFSLRTSAIERELAAFSAVQFQHADREHARHAVLVEIRTLEALQRLTLQLPQNKFPQNHVSENHLSENHLSENHALYIAYARLAMIEGAAGNASAAEFALAKAEEHWRTLHPGGEAAAPEQMKQAVRDFDSQSEDARFRH